MPVVTIRNVPANLLDDLKRDARAEHRSLNGHLLALLERSHLCHRIAPEHLRQRRERFRVFLAETGGGLPIALTIDQMNAAIEEG